MQTPTPTTAPSTAPTRSLGATLWLLSLANFAVGMGAYVVIGILSPLAADLGVGKAEAGSLMTVYAVVYALSSPLLVAVTGRVDRTWALVGGMAAFSVGALAAALSGSLYAVLAARCVMLSAPASSLRWLLRSAWRWPAPKAVAGHLPWCSAG